MPVRSANAVWEGSFAEGSGRMMMESGAYEGAFGAASRFEEGEGTNPEELIAAAHAGCFSMSLSAGLTRAGHPPTKIETTAKVHINKLEEGWRITLIELDTRADVPGVDEATFLEKAEAAKAGCPVSNALAGVPEIRLAAKLV
jgi:osmotically inducible protein OsmC